jgi:hTAFII28-like protein conserved region
MEQSRFEAFRRAAFPADAISTYVAQCLIDEHGETKRSPILSELVAPGHAEEICIVVSTLAKAYAQRLVTAARSFAGAPTEPIEPEHILQAFQQRQGRGQDPGFFFQTVASKTILKDGAYQRKRLAALKAQNDHDKLYPPPPSSVANADNDKQDAMQISSPAKADMEAERHVTPAAPANAGP